MPLIPRSSYTDEDLAALATDARELLRGGISAGRRFWLRGMQITNEHATDAGVLELWDQAAEGADPTATGQRGAFRIPGLDTVVFEFPAPGILFTAGLLATVTAGTFSAYSQQCWGYEE